MWTLVSANFGAYSGVPEINFKHLWKDQEAFSTSYRHTMEQHIGERITFRQWDGTGSREKMTGKNQFHKGIKRPLS